MISKNWCMVLLQLLSVGVCFWGCSSSTAEIAQNSGNTYTTTVSTLNISGGVTIDVPLTNGLGIAVADVPVTLHGENGALYATRWTASPSKILIDTNTAGSTIAGEGNNLIVLYVSISNNDIRAKESTDGGLTWGSAHSFGTRPTGPALPTACLFRVGGVLNRAIGWSHQPSSTHGPLKVARHNGTSWGSVTDNAIDSSGAALYCANDMDPEVVWRDHRAGSTGLNPRLYRANINASSQLVSEQLVRNPGNDPSYCGQGSYRFVGAHTGLNDAHLLRSNDSGTSFSEIDTESAYSGSQLDDQGKFVSVACRDGVVAASWGDWPTKSDADTYAPTRKLGFIISKDWGSSFTALRPAGEDTEQGPATVAVSGGIA